MILIPMVTKMILNHPILKVKEDWLQLTQLKQQPLPTSQQHTPPILPTSQLPTQLTLHTSQLPTQLTLRLTLPRIHHMLTSQQLTLQHLLM